MKILFPKTYGLIHNNSQTRQKTSTKIKKKHMKFLQQKKIKPNYQDRYKPLGTTMSAYTTVGAMY